LDGVPPQRCRRHAQKVAALGPIEDPEDVQMRKPVDIGEAQLELGEKVEHAFGRVLCRGPLRDLSRSGVWAPDEPDGAQ
jgi:hypothetical protein